MRHALALALLLLAAPAAGAATIVIDFEALPLGSLGTSYAAEGVILSSLSGLRVDERAGSHVLTIGEEGGELLLTFTAAVTGMALDFGADSGHPSVRSGLAILTGSADGVPVAIDSVTANRNSLLDQMLSIAHAPGLGWAVFRFPQLGEDEPLSSAVDNLVLTTVPEPGTLGLAALAIIGLRAARIRSRTR